MRLAHAIKISVFCKEDEDAEKIRKALFSLLPFDIKYEKIKLKESTAKGFEDKKIRVLEVILEKERHTTHFIKKLLSDLDNKQKRILLDQAGSRLDKNLHFFIRLDKRKLIMNKFEVTDKGDCFHINITLAVFPKKREIALTILKNMLS